MRIIITDNGKIILKKLNHSSSCPSVKMGNFPSRALNNSKQILSVKNKIQHTQSNSMSMSEFIKYQDITKNNLFPRYSKLIKVKEKNLKIPLSFLKKYEENKKIDETVSIVKQSNIILSALENELIKEEKSRNYSTKSICSYSNPRINSGKLNHYFEKNSLPKIKSHYSIGEIINKNCFEKLNKKLTEKINKEKYDIKIDNRFLRKEFSSDKIFGLIDKEKNKAINSNNYKLIEYLMKKTTITDKFLKRINDSNDDNLMKMNKISSKILLDKERQKNYYNKIKEKLCARKEKETEQFRQILLKINNKVKNDIKDNHMDIYRLVKDSNKGVYKNVFKNFRRQYWKKQDNFARFFPKEQRIHYKEI